MKGDNSFIRLARLLLAGVAGVFTLTGGLSATSAGNSGDPEVSDPVLLWPLHINVPYDIVHMIPEEARASLILRIDEEGRVIDWVALELPHIRLVRPIDLALQSARFQPAMMEGEPVMLDMTVSVPVGEIGYYGIINLDPTTYMEIKLTRMSGGLHSLRLAPGAALDEPLRLIDSGQPVAYMDESGNPVTGSVEVEFYVDQDGSPRIIRSNPEDDPLLREAAHLTVEQFRFAPPRSRGRPAVVKARMTVRF